MNTKPLSSVPVNKRNDVRVTWAEGMRPSAFPFPEGTQGRVFLSKGRETVVIFDGSTFPHRLATKALVAVL